MADKGQLTGYSGLTGFAVKRRLSHEKDSFVRTANAIKTWVAK
jgi:hypothetical protein